MREYHCSVCGKSIWMEYEPSNKHLLCSECKGVGMKKATFQRDLKGVCSKSLSFAIREGRLHDVKFSGGCPGCTAGIARLVEGMKPAEVVGKLENIICQGKQTSCPDQLAKAVSDAMKFIEE